jgi:hypothetical protein
MLLKLAPIVILAGALTTPALATEWMYCSGGDATIGFLLGSLQGFRPSAITIDVGDKHWSTSEVYGKGTTITFGQAFEDDHTLLVDVMDEWSDKPVAQLRIFKAPYEDKTVSGGILIVFGEGAWTASCEYDY